MIPKRVQRQRRKGWRQPDNTKYCGRPSEWANPFLIEHGFSRERALKAFRLAFWTGRLPITPERAYYELSQFRFLSCWCREDEDCHVDELIAAIIRAGKARAGPCPYCGHRLTAHYTVEVENDEGDVVRRDAVCFRCNTDTPADPSNDMVCLTLSARTTAG